MKIALPVIDTSTIYKDNPYTAPQFAIYNINRDKDNISFGINTIIKNPWNTSAHKKFSEDQLKCKCSHGKKENIEHKCEHYVLLSLIYDCSYLLANKYCSNTEISMRNSGITIINIPPIINQIDSAIKNFLIGASIASTHKHIHHAS